VNSIIYIVGLVVVVVAVLSFFGMRWLPGATFRTLAGVIGLWWTPP